MNKQNIKCAIKAIQKIKASELSPDGFKYMDERNGLVCLNGAVAKICLDVKYNHQRGAISEMLPRWYSEDYDEGEEILSEIDSINFMRTHGKLTITQAKKRVLKYLRGLIKK